MVLEQLHINSKGTQRAQSADVRFSAITEVPELFSVNLVLASILWIQNVFLMPGLKDCISSTLITRLAVSVQWEGQHPKKGELPKRNGLKLWGATGCSMCEGTRGESYPTVTLWTYKHIHMSEPSCLIPTELPVHCLINSLSILPSVRRQIVGR